MTKTDIAERIQAKTGLSKKESAEMLEAVFGIFKNTLEGGEKIRIAGFGNFVVRKKTDRRGRNPQTGEAITIESRRVVTFKPSQILKQAVNSKNVSITSETSPKMPQTSRKRLKMPTQMPTKMPTPDVLMGNRK